MSHFWIKKSTRIIEIKSNLFYIQNSIPNHRLSIDFDPYEIYKDDGYDYYFVA